MKTNETLKLLDDKDFLDKIYHFSYHRCNTSIEAEDLCSDIVLAVISAIHKQECIENFYAFVWTIARRVYADYCEKRNAERQVFSVKIHVEPNEPGAGYVFENKVVGGAIPKEYIPAVDAGIQGALTSGILAGYQVVDIKVTLYDGSYHEVDSSEMAFKIAGSMAIKEALRKAGSILTEPIMKVVVVVPDDYMGDVIGDLNSRRGQIQGMDPIAGGQQIRAFVPLSNMFGYATDLRSKTQGRGTYVMEPSHYEQVPKNIQETIVSERGKKE